MVFNMMERKDRKQGKANLILLEDLVPDNHILRKIDKAIDFSFIYEEVEGLYSEQGRPGIDPVSLFKIVFIQYLFGKPLFYNLRQSYFIYLLTYIIIYYFIYIFKLIFYCIFKIYMLLFK